MRKPRIILLEALAGLVLLGAGIGAAEPVHCPRDPSPMSDALYSVITKAERAAEGGDPLGAAAVLEEYLAKNPEETHPYPYYDTGYFLHRAGNSDPAVDYLQKTTELDPCFMEAWQLLAVLHQEAGRKEQAAAALAKAADITRDPGERYRSALLWLDAGFPEKALATLEMPEPGSPKNVDGYVAEARAHQALKRSNRAAEAMENAYALSGDPGHVYQSALFWLEAGRPGRALPLLRELTASRTPESRWLVALSAALKALKKKEETAEAMEKAAGISGDPELLFHAARLWLEADRPENALGLLERLAERKRPQVNWLLALTHTYMLLEQTEAAAGVMDQVVRLDPQSEYVYNAGVLWLHADQPAKALGHLLSLCERIPGKAEWFAALAHAWSGQKELTRAAEAMEQAATLGGQADYAYQAGLLWIQAHRPDAAVRRLVPLSRQSRPRAEWLALLSQAWLLLEDVPRAAQAMEKAANITRQGEDYFRAGKLWLHAGDPAKGISLLRMTASAKPVKPEWLVSLGQALMDSEQTQEALAVMARTALTDPEVKPSVRYQGAVLWLQMKRPREALPILKVLCGERLPAAEWLSALVKTHVELEQTGDAEKALERLIDLYPEDPRVWRLAAWVAIEQAHYIRAAAAMAVAVRLGPPDADQMMALADLYHMAGVPVKAASVLQETWKQNPAAADWDRLVRVYLRGHRYEPALAAARSALAAGETAERWRTIGAIAFRLRRFEESLDAYGRSAEMSPAAGTRLNAGYAALKMDRLDEAEHHFQEAMRLGDSDGSAVREAHRNLAFIRKMKAFGRIGG